MSLIRPRMIQSQLTSRRQFLRTSGIAVSAGILTGSSWKFYARQAAAAEATSKLLVHTAAPCNAETPLDKLVASWITPNELFYIRSHGSAPQVDAERLLLSIEGLVSKPLKLSLKQLQTEFKKQAVVATLTCAGNRRNEHSLVKKVSGVPWQAGAIGNAQWGGARLSDILKKVGIQEGAKHVWFEGVDDVDHGGEIIPFGASIPLETAMTDHAHMPGALVAYDMNDQPLSRDHGFPLRTVVPGLIGARSVKWLGKIIVSDRPSTNHFVAEAYKIVTEGTDQEWSEKPPIYTFPINSATCLPATGAKLKSGQTTISGYAIADGVAGRTIGKVEVSIDGGESWTKTDFTSPAKPFCWRIWQANLPLTAETRELIVRATDSAGNVQPKEVDWNLKGYLFNAWHRTPVNVEG